MIICKAPFRISILGGGSDHPEFIDKHGHGLVISTSINKYSYINIKKLFPFHSYKTKITYDYIEKVNDNICISNNIFRECIRFTDLQNEPLEINHISDIPGGSGLGTSSTTIVCLLEAINEYKYKHPYKDKISLWRDAFYVEKTLMKETVGLQDYLPAIHGWAYGYKITNNEVKIISLNHEFKNIIRNCGLLFYLGKTRSSSDILKTYTNQLPDSNNQLLIRKFAEEGLNATTLEHVGVLLKESWQLKKGLSPEISNKYIDDVIEICLKNGAYGAKLCGGGGGGCIFALADPNDFYNIIEAVKEVNVKQIPFKIAPRGVERVL